MNRILNFVLLAFVPGILSAQTTAATANASKAIASPNLSLSDISRAKERPEWGNVVTKGTPFLVEEWRVGTVVLPDNRRIEGVQLRLNCVSNAIHFQNEEKEEQMIATGSVKQVVFTDTSEKGIHTYLLTCGYPAIDNQNQNTFYETTVSGKAELLLYTTKRVVRLLTGAGNEHEYFPTETYYLFKDGQIREWKKGKDALTEFLSDKKEAVTDFINTQKLKCKTIDEVKKVLLYYNSL